MPTIGVDATLQVEQPDTSLAPLQVADDAESPTGVSLPVYDGQGLLLLGQILSVLTAQHPFVFHQASPSAMWHIVHGRGSNPTVVLQRDDNQTINGFGIDYPDLNTVDIYPGLIAGTATLIF